MRWMRGLDRDLAQEGLTFTRAFVSVPACCPSRATFFTGQYVHNHEVFYQNDRYVRGKHLGAYKAFRANGHEQDGLATRMSAAGYKTSLVGKYINHYDSENVPRGWDDWHAWVGAGGGKDGRMNENGRIVDHGDWSRENPGHTDLVSDRATSFIKRSKDEPFMLVIPDKAPHAPAIPPRRHQDAFPKVRLPKGGSYNERDVSDKPRWVRRKARLTSDEESRLRFIHRKRLQSMLAVQDMVRRITAVLQRQGKLDNTYIMFTSDNGFHLGQHRLAQGKLSPYEEDVEVPFIVRGPGIKAGTKSGQLTSHTDIMPTILDLAGAEVPDDVDGRSLKPMLEGETAEPRRSLLIEQWKYPGGRAKHPPTYRAVRTAANYKYVEYANGEEELYNLRRDPHEMRNLAGKRPRLQRKLGNKLEELGKCSGDDCRTAESSP